MAHDFEVDPDDLVTDIHRFISGYSARTYGQPLDFGAGSQPRRVPSYSGLVLDDDSHTDVGCDDSQYHNQYDFDSRSSYTATTASTAARTALSSVWTHGSSHPLRSIAGRGESPPPRGHDRQPLEHFFQAQAHHHYHPPQGHHQNTQLLWCEFSELLKCRCP